MPSLVPRFQRAGKLLLRGLAERPRDSSELYAGWKNWLSGQMPSDYLLLMKVTHLDRNIAKDSSYSRPTICYDSRYHKPFCFNLSSGSVVTFNSFIIDFFPEDILFDSIGSQNQDSILTTEAGGISNNDRFAGRNASCWQFVTLQLFSDPVWTSTVIFGQLSYSSTPIYKTAPDSFLEFLRSWFTLKMLMTIQACIALEAGLKSFFLCVF